MCGRASVHTENFQQREKRVEKLLHQPHLQITEMTLACDGMRTEIDKRQYEVVDRGRRRGRGYNYNRTSMRFITVGRALRL